MFFLFVAAAVGTVWSYRAAGRGLSDELVHAARWYRIPMAADDGTAIAAGRVVLLAMSGVCCLIAVLTLLKLLSGIV